MGRIGRVLEGAEGAEVGRDLMTLSHTVVVVRRDYQQHEDHPAIGFSEAPSEVGTVHWA